MSGDTPLLSVVTPSFESGRFIGETLDSVAALPFPHEHLVIDGGSGDGTREILAARNDSRLTWISEADRGQTHAVNKGFERASGELVAWLNADDAYAPEGVRRAVETLVADPAIDAVFGFTDIVDARGEFIRQYRCGAFSWYRYLYAGAFLATPTVIFRRSLLERTGPLDERWKDAADYDFYLRLLRGARVERIPESIVRFRIHRDSKTGSNLALQVEEALAIRLEYASGPLQRGLMRAIAAARAARERVVPFWRHAEVR